MSIKISRLAIYCCFLLLYKCANRGTTSGGEKDVTPPKIIKEVPENFSTNFKSNEIKIYFDEYIKLKNLQKQLIISPPMDPLPEIIPMGSASKYITIKILDTLQTNTTYTFNFGYSIEDNNEGNAFPFYKYVLSTGSSIDSLSVTGIISDAFEIETPEFISVHLHDLDSTYNDSIIFKQKPKYIGVTDSLSQFNIENLKEGKYLLTALKEENTDYIYQSKKDKIAFKKDFITVPSDTNYYLKLFKQIPDQKFIRARQLAQGRIGFGYEGNSIDMKIKGISKEFDSIYVITSKEPEKDTLNLWMRPRKIEVDSLLFQVSLSNKVDTVSVRIKKMEKDSLTFKVISSTLKLGDFFKLKSSIPLTDFNQDKVSVMDKDSLFLKTNMFIDSINNTELNLKFDLSEGNRYKIAMLPGAIKDFYSNINDTLNYNVNTKLLSSYGNLRLIVRNGSYPLIIQIVSKNGEVIAEKIINDSKPIDFINLDPGEYFIRTIYDTNKNGKYDPGNFLKKIQPERVSYAKEILEVRAGWDSIEEFVLED